MNPCDLVLKRCSKCKEERELSRFYRSSKRKDGYQSQCKECRKFTADRYHAQPGVLNRSVQYSRSWVQNNSYRYLQIQKRYRVRRRANDTAFKLLHNLRGRLRDALKGNPKQAHTIELLGCTTDELKIYLENKFLERMTWENYGVHGWHIDHIRPCASFDLTDPAQQKACFHFSNLQPLWALDNILKSNSYVKI